MGFSLPSTRSWPWVLAGALWALPAVARADDWYVDAKAGPGGDGSMADPFQQIQDALDVAVAGDVIHVLPGTYAPIATVSDGTGGAPITVQAEPAGDAIVQADGTALEAHHEYHTFQGLVLEGDYGAEVVDADGANFLELIDVEVRRGRNCIDLHTVEGVLIEASRIHHCVYGGGASVDGHGITGGSVFDLEVRDSEIYLFSGAAVFLSGPRLPWTGLQIRRCVLWAGALDETVGAHLSGTLIGESALDTQVGFELDGNGNPPTVVVEDVVAHGYLAYKPFVPVFNIQEEVDALVNRVTIYDSELAFTLGGLAQVRVQNAVVHSVTTGVRYEYGLSGAQILASTFGDDVASVFIDGGGDAPVVENLLVLGDSVPDEAAAGMANLAVGPEAFVDAAAHDYYLVEGAEPIDAGVMLDGVASDRNGTARPMGEAFDIGAYEWSPDGPPPPMSDSSGGESGSDSGSEGDGTDSGGGSGSNADTTAAGETGGSATGSPGMDDGSADGCGCRNRTTGAADPALLVGLLAAARRRRGPRIGMAAGEPRADGLRIRR